LKEFVHIFNKNAEKLFTKLQLLQSDPEVMEKGFDIQDYFMRYTLDSFAEIGFGVQVGSIDDEFNHFAAAFDYVQTFSERRGRKGSLWPIIETIFPDNKFKDHLAYMNTYTMEIIRQRLKESDSGDLSERGDLISQLLCKTEDKYSNDELRDFVMNFLIAGRDTTAAMLTWTFYLLSKHPEVEERVLKEIRDVLGDDLPNWNNIKALKYTKNVLQEALRLFPPVPVDGYTAYSDDILPGGYAMRKGGEIYYCSYVLHRNPKYFPNPDEFIPERWDTPLPHPFCYVPFHSGPRTCLGKEMVKLLPFAIFYT
jgi:cytochrome P450